MFKPQQITQHVRYSVAESSEQRNSHKQYKDAITHNKNLIYEYICVYNQSSGLD